MSADTAASIRQQALDSLHQYAALYTAALKDGYTVDDNIQAQVDGSVEQIRNYAAQNGTTFSVYLRSSYGPYMTEKVLRECLTQQAVANAYYSDHADSLTYDKAQLESYYDEHKDELDSFTYSAAFINGEAVSSTDADGNTVDPTDAEKATAMSVAKATAGRSCPAGRGRRRFRRVGGGVCRSGRQVLLQGGDDRPRLRLDQRAQCRLYRLAHRRRPRERGHHHHRGCR